MTTSTAVQWRKEVRELLPFWVATVVTMVGCWALMRPDALPADSMVKWLLSLSRAFLLGVGLITYAAGAVILGAVSIGNEYAHDTLTQLLVQPASRAQVLRIKLIVLALMQATLGVLAFATWGAEPGWDSISGAMGRSTLIILPLAAGLLLAPWLTMVGRNALGGAAFTAVLPAALWMVVVYIRLPPPLIWTGAAVLAVAGPVMTWRTFMRLEVTGSSQDNVDLSAWFSGSGDQVRVARVQHPVWVLVKKELRLQHATLVVAGLYVAIWLMVVIDRLLGLQLLTNSPLFVVTVVNGILVPLLCGALASAGERQFGVSDWQTLLPIAAWRQWAIKSGVALGMTFALAVLLPMFLASIAGETGWRDGMEPATVGMLCVAALYVSSLSTNGLRALLATVPAIAVGIAAVLVVQFVMLSPRTGLALPAIREIAKALPVVAIDAETSNWWRRHGWELATAGSAILLLVLGYANQRTADRSRGRIARQLGWISVYAAAAGIVISLVNQTLWVWLNAPGQ